METKSESYFSYLDGGDSSLLRHKRDEGTPLALALGVPKNGALFNGTVPREKRPYVVFTEFLVQHPHEKFAFWNKRDEVC